MLLDDQPLAPPMEPVGQAAPAPVEEGRNGSRRRWRVAAILLAALLLLAGYLAVTAPLSKSLQPITAPALTLLSADGTPIARRGAITDAPVTVETLPDHVANAFLAIEAVFGSDLPKNDAFVSAVKRAYAKLG